MNPWAFIGWLLIFLVLAIMDSRLARIQRELGFILNEVKKARDESRAHGK